MATDKLIRTVAHSRRFYSLNGKRISEKEACLLIAQGTPCEYRHKAAQVSA